MNIVTGRLGPLLVLTLTSAIASAAHANDVGGPHPLDSYIEQVMAGWRVPGLAVAVINDGEVVLAKGYGILEAGAVDRVDADTVFQIGSMSKSFAATAAAVLVDEGKLEWDRPAIDYLKQLRYSDPWLTGHVTVRDLASNRVGIDDDLAWLHRSIGTPTLISTVRYMTAAEPFRSFLYSNTGFATLGAVTEAASGQKWHDLIRMRLLEPLGMRRSGTGAWAYVQPDYLARCWACVPPKPIVGRAALMPGVSNVAAPHGVLGGPLIPPGRRAATVVLPWHYESAGPAAGAVTSTANDMARWLKFHLNHGSIDGKRVLSDAQARTLHAYQVLARSREAVASTQTGPDVPGYALGWQKRIYHGFDVSWHGGGQVGFGSMMWLVPERRLAVVVMQNLDFSAAPATNIVAQRLVDHYLALPVTDWNQRAQQRWARRSAAAVAPAPLRKTPVVAGPLLGAFSNEIMGGAEVREEAGALWLQFEPTSRARLQALANGDFVATFAGTETNPIQLRLRFEYDDNGRASGFDCAEEGARILRHHFRRE